MDSSQFRFVEITDLNDDLLLPWLDLYETAFPTNERGLVSDQLGLVKAKMSGSATSGSILAAVDQQNSLKGIMHYEVVPELSVALLWYFAVKPEFRGQGLGSQMYVALIKELAAHEIKTLVLEVERPDRTTSKKQRRIAERRIEFFRRLGAKRLLGVHYLQHAGGHQPPTPMYLMIHPLQPIDAEVAFGLTKVIFSDAIEQVGPLDFEQSFGLFQVSSQP